MKYLQFQNILIFIFDDLVVFTMKKINYSFFGIGLIFSGFTVHAQQDAQISQYMFNALYYNPAYAGVEGVTKFSALHRSQWTGYEPTVGEGGATNTQLALLTHRF